MTRRKGISLLEIVISLAITSSAFLLLLSMQGQVHRIIKRNCLQFASWIAQNNLNEKSQ